uniref:Uncharacterized protein n=1 Tax=Rhizophora mucronata TaxID=61149 RepID=A0A2P2LFE0_RHIMU
MVTGTWFIVNGLLTAGLS